MNEKATLQLLIDSGMIDLAEMQTQIEMSKRKKYLDMHEYEIWQGKDDAWYTYLPDDKVGRRLKRRVEKRDLENLIIEFYKQKEDNPYFRELFLRWMDERREYHEIEKNSDTRYMNDFHRFFPEDEEFCKIRIHDIDESDIEKFIKRTISRLELTEKAYSGLRILLRGTFKYAKREKLTDISISTFFNDLVLPQKIFKRVRKNPEDEVFNEEEAFLLTCYFRQNPTIVNLGLLLMFQTGMRVGELAVLMKSDITSEGIHVCKTEERYKDYETGRIIVDIKDAPKGSSDDRTVIITDEASAIVKKIMMLNPFGEFLFMKDEKRIRTKSFNYYLKKACRDVGIAEKSTHKIRKTYGSTLLDNDVDESLVKEQMGHKDISTTKSYYYFNTNSYSKKKQQITKAVSF